jgi:hypothetical protein
MARDLSIEPIELNATARVTADGLQWLLQKREPHGRWLSVSYCQTRAGLMASATKPTECGASIQTPGRP